MTEMTFVNVQANSLVYDITEIMKEKGSESAWTLVKMG